MRGRSWSLHSEPAAERTASPSFAGVESYRVLWVLPRAGDGLGVEWALGFMSGDLGFSFHSVSLGCMVL